MKAHSSFRPNHLLVTGGAGFIGSNFIRYALDTDPRLRITNLDCLAYSGNLTNLHDVVERFGPSTDKRYRFVHGDIRNAPLVQTLLDRASHGWPAVDAIVHLAAESHVDRSIIDATPFVETNVIGTATLLRAVQRTLEAGSRRIRFLHVSTDEVYGSLGPADPPFTEQHPLAPTSPYAASKAGADLLVSAYVRTYQLPAVISRCSNNYGPFQYPEKLIPLMIVRALARESLPVYGDGSNVRDWIHVLDHCAALWCVLGGGSLGECYNIGAACEISNLQLVEAILDQLDRPRSLIKFVTDRPGHDRRYAMNNHHLSSNLDWHPCIDLTAGLAATIEWYQQHEHWWQPLLDESRRAERALYQA